MVKTKRRCARLFVDTFSPLPIQAVSLNRNGYSVGYDNLQKSTPVIVELVSNVQPLSIKANPPGPYCPQDRALLDLWTPLR